jgi:mRNA interferase MazF
MHDRGTVVLVRFPFTDLLSAKQRPAVVLSSRAHQRSGKDLIVAAISGHRADRPGRFDHPIEAWSAAGLLMPSVVRAGKLVTLHRGVIRRALGRLETADLEAVDGMVRKAIAL